VHAPELSVDEAIERAVALARAGRRSVLGIAGAPGAGKSTLARRVVAAVDAELGVGTAVQVPMDGFHLANAALDALGRRDRKGAIDTFDADGYVALVRRLAAAPDTDGGAVDPDTDGGAAAPDTDGGAAAPDTHGGAAAGGTVVWAPDFDRRIDEPVAGSIAVPATARLVVSEGNYLLDETEPWAALRDLFAETWFCAVDDAVRVDRLVGRHMRHGRDHDAARAWALEVDGVNAARIAPTASRASRTVRT